MPKFVAPKRLRSVHKIAGSVSTYSPSLVSGEPCKSITCNSEAEGVEARQGSGVQGWGGTHHKVSTRGLVRVERKFGE